LSAEKFNLCPLIDARRMEVCSPLFDPNTKERLEEISAKLLMKIHSSEILLDNTCTVFETVLKNCSIKMRTK
jgi:hypothetical protein